MSGVAPSPLFNKTAAWFERSHAALLGALPCRAGCHRCCIGLFPVTVLDRQAVRHGLSRLPNDQQQTLIRNASDQADLLSAAAPRLRKTPLLEEWPDEDIDQFAEHYRELPCPALQSDGTCGIYAFRPLTCRSMGIPPEEDGIVQGACDIQTFVPLVRLPRVLRQEEDLLAQREAGELAAEHQRSIAAGEELFLPFAFLPLNERRTTT